MSRRVVYAALIAVNLILLVNLVVGILVSRRAESPPRPLLRSDAAEVVRIRLAGGPDDVDLVRTDTWDLLLEGERLPARFDRVELLLEGLERSRIVRRVTEDRELHDRFGVGPATGRRVTVETGAQEMTYVVGHVEQTGRVYAREAGSDRVWAVQSNVDFYLRQSSTFWAYLRLFPEDARPADIVRAQLSGDLVQSFEVVRDARNAWLLRMDGAEYALSGPAVERFASQVVDLVGNGYYVGDFNLLYPVAELRFSLVDGRTFSAEFRGGDDILVARASGPRLPGDPYGGLLYTISDPSLEGIRRLADELPSG